MHSFQPLLCLLQVTGIIPLPSFRGCQEGFDTQINSDLTASGWLFNHLNFALDGHKVFSGLGFRHGEILWSAFPWTMKLCFDPTDLWHIGEVFVELEALGKADGLTVSFTFEAWELHPFLKEVFVGALQISNRSEYALHSRPLHPNPQGSTYLLGYPCCPDHHLTGVFIGKFDPE